MDKDEELDSIVIAAASLLAGSVHATSYDRGRTTVMIAPTPSEIEMAVRIAKMILKQASF